MAKRSADKVRYELFRRVSENHPWRMINSSNEQSTMENILKDKAPKRFPGQEFKLVDNFPPAPEAEKVEIVPEA